MQNDKKNRRKIDMNLLKNIDQIDDLSKCRVYFHPKNGYYYISVLSSRERFIYRVTSDFLENDSSNKNEIWCMDLNREKSKIEDSMKQVSKLPKGLIVRLW